MLLSEVTVIFPPLSSFYFAAKWYGCKYASFPPPSLFMQAQSEDSRHPLSSVKSASHSGSGKLHPCTHRHRRAEVKHAQRRLLASNHSEARSITFKWADSHICFCQQHVHSHLSSRTHVRTQTPQETAFGVVRSDPGFAVDDNTYVTACSSLTCPLFPSMPQCSNVEGVCPLQCDSFVGIFCFDSPI